MKGPVEGGGRNKKDTGRGAGEPEEENGGELGGDFIE